MNATVPSYGTFDEDMPTCSTFINNNNNEIPQLQYHQTQHFPTFDTISDTVPSSSTTATADNNTVFNNNYYLRNGIQSLLTEISEFRAFISNNNIPQLAFHDGIVINQVYLKKGTGRLIK
uniref:Uncharacterized protein n=1 Tax=Panagrolaimus superbus TaxID=310955 RepID=A0A914YSC1_9BILA